MKGLLAVALAAALAGPLGYVVPAERLLPDFEAARARVSAVRVRAELAGPSGERDAWPESVLLEVHPELGYRASDDRGGRWLLQRGRLMDGTGPAPDWIPELEVLLLKTGDDLRSWLARAGVDLSRNALARHGESDCFVIGGRDGRAQLWLDKDRLDIVRWVAGGGRSVEYLRHSDWDGIRFPSVVELRENDNTLATLSVESVTGARDLGPADFEIGWIRSER